MLKIVSMAIVGTVLSSVLSENKKEFVLPIRLCTVILMAFTVFSFAGNKISSLLSLLGDTDLPIDVTSLLLKGVAICLISSVCSSLCRENGNSSAADMIELCARVLTVVLCLPLIESVIKTALSFI